MESVPGLNLLPEKWQPFAVMFVVWLIPFATRAWHAWKNNGGWQGIKNSFLYGTNVPKP